MELVPMDETMRTTDTQAATEFKPNFLNSTLPKPYKLFQVEGAFDCIPLRPNSCCGFDWPVLRKKPVALSGSYTVKELAYSLTQGERWQVNDSMALQMWHPLTMWENAFQSSASINLLEVTQVVVVFLSTSRNSVVGMQKWTTISD